MYTIKNSYLINDIKEMENEIKRLYSQNILSHNRTINSYVREWYAHNWLYNHNMFVSHTKDADLEFNINIILEIGYWLIFMIGKMICH